MKSNLISHRREIEKAINTTHNTNFHNGVMITCSIIVFFVIVVIVLVVFLFLSDFDPISKFVKISTPTFSITSSPSLTLSPSPTITKTITPTATNVPSQTPTIMFFEGCSTTNGLPMRSNLNSNYDTVSLLNQNDCGEILGRDETGDWVLITFQQEQINISGWVSSIYIKLNNDELIINLPVLKDEIVP